MRSLLRFNRPVMDVNAIGGFNPRTHPLSPLLCRAQIGAGRFQGRLHLRRLNPSRVIKGRVDLPQAPKPFGRFDDAVQPCQG